MTLAVSSIPSNEAAFASIRAAANSPGRVPEELVIVTEPDGPRAEAIRALRTHIVAHHLHRGRRALAVCAPSSGVGCSFVAANLAVALSQVSINTLLIDADLRAPAIERFIPPLQSAEGLKQQLAGASDTVGDYIQMGVAESLSIIYAGGAAPDAQELIGGDRFEALMQSCLRDFDITIVDTPPANMYADARRIASVVGYGVVVARRNVSLLEDVRTLVGELTVDQVEVVGTVLNEA